MKRAGATEQTRSLHAITGGDAVYHRIIDSLPVAVCSCDQNGKIIVFNDLAAQLLKHTPAIHDDALNFFSQFKVYTSSGSYVPHNQFPMITALETGQAFHNVEVIMERPDGSQLHTIINITPIFDQEGGIVGNSCIFQALDSHNAILEKEIEERTKDLVAKNEEFKKSEERYHKMIEEVQDYAILLLDKSGIIQNWNVGAEKIKGYKENEIIGKSFRSFYLPEDQLNGLPEKLLQEAKEKGRALHEGWRVRKDGSRFWGSIVITALHDENGEIIGFSKVTRDLSEKKIAEDKIQQYASELEFQNRELEEFAYAASHDLKEPLRKIHFYNTYLADNCAGDLSEKGREYLERSISAVRRMRQLIEDILSYTKNTTSIGVYENVDLSEIAEEIAQQHKDELTGNKVFIKLEKLPVVKGISFQLRQVLDNLVSNSIKYRHPDRDCIITVSSRLVDASQVPAKNPPAKYYYRISVEDNGLGFDQRYAEKIFEIFQRLQAKTETSGAGIGLAICKKIMQNHKGFIHAKGTPNEGACFEFYLPV